MIRLVGAFNLFFISVYRWYSKCVLQHKGQELMDGLKMAFAGKLLLLSWTFLQIKKALTSGTDSGVLFFIFIRGIERLPQIQQLSSITHHCVSRWRGGRAAAQRGQLRDFTNLGVHQVHGTRLRVGPIFFFLSSKNTVSWSSSWTL